MNELRGSVELRGYSEADGTGRLIGVLLPYETRARDRNELFDKGSLYWEGSVPLTYKHDSAAAVMNVIPQERDSQLIIDALLPPTPAGRILASLVKDGTLGEMSVAFLPEAEEMRGGVRVITRAKLTAAGVVAKGAYKTAVSVRSRKNSHRRRWR